VSSDTPSDAVAHCRIEGPALQHVLEFNTFEYPLSEEAMVGLPATPGAVTRDPSGLATLLHFAPGRFLIPAPSPECAARLDALQSAAVGALFDVEGKWQRFTLTGPGAERVLSSAINLTQVLADRECAAAHLFDCPSILTRQADAFDLWVEASYARAFRGHLAGGTAFR
jgi:heterotetrameric sarcosine oxidase gamma subunit